MKLDYAKIALRNLRMRSKRTWLTMIGIFIGIAAVVALTSLGQGLEQAIIGEFSAVGGDKIFIQAKSAGFGHPGFQKSGQVGEDDIDVVKRVNGVLDVGGQIFRPATIEFSDEQVVQYIASVPDDESYDLIIESQSYKIMEGRMVRRTDKGKVMIGKDYVMQDIFKTKPRVGNKLKINGQSFEIVGILERTGDPGADRAIVASIEDVREILDIEDEFNYLVVRVSPSMDPEDAVEPLTRAMRRDRGLKEGKEDFQIETATQLIESFKNILVVVQMVLIGIACISLLVGGIGIMNTMYTSVLERTKEIGIMKAIGARNSDVLSIFLIESGLLGMAGGAIGVVIGASLSKFVEILGQQVLDTTLLKAQFPWYLIVGALVFSFVIGTLSGILPARQASHLKPVDALRYE
ncbi:MAG TPA: ABC transporter permease [Candidatus Nanoarchaeia archaeon]|nr:ABC transporter permease [Candidatus Nanoarchaeia archaeon]